MHRCLMLARLSLNRRDVPEIVDPGLREAFPDLSSGAQFVLLSDGPNADTKQFFAALWCVSIGGGVNAIASLRTKHLRPGVALLCNFYAFLEGTGIQSEGALRHLKGGVIGRAGHALTVRAVTNTHPRFIYFRLAGNISAMTAAIHMHGVSS